MAKITPIIEFQEDRQRTPQEALDFLQGFIDTGRVTHLIAIYHNGSKQGYVSGGKDRDYNRSQMLWDIFQWIKHFI